MPSRKLREQAAMLCSAMASYWAMPFGTFREVLDMHPLNHHFDWPDEAKDLANRACSPPNPNVWSESNEWLVKAWAEAHAMLMNGEIE